mmetsp:Transcript_75468/g.157394  ORF Transcript_75468/g.157394 Transcript_75468/m.157394 type:complete len:396 (+) Transcript_75468:236-1423(+)|eukprot:CAMPEP_0206459844 /NCGR_PEP_ID=MMETSP0324_2-20121206/24414_1 /ASSEMBLY_ACC=CAM_ASM_000836 /TAXON_ID=2866 /ORGANISM="Crypthecodinium cohnii, Strain Seligo" /LENGTH=395 /DNA_ID=CAMNT_0053931465 /DNA_START=183 /DNA_END=1370 /DNA_ORIENTATION=+
MGCSTSTSAVAVVPVHPHTQVRRLSNKSNGKIKVSPAAPSSEPVALLQILPGSPPQKCRAPTETSRTTCDTTSLDSLKDMSFGGSLETLETVESCTGSLASSLLEEAHKVLPELPLKPSPSSTPSTSAPSSSTSRIFYPRNFKSEDECTLARDVSIVPRGPSQVLCSPVEVFLSSPSSSAAMTPIPSGSCAMLSIPSHLEGCSDADGDFSIKSPDDTWKGCAKGTPSAPPAESSTNDPFFYYYSTTATTATNTCVGNLKTLKRGSGESPSVTRTVTWASSVLETLAGEEKQQKEAERQEAESQDAPLQVEVHAQSPTPSLTTQKTSKKRESKEHSPKQVRRVSFSKQRPKDTPGSAGVLDSMVANVNGKVTTGHLLISEELLLSCLMEAFTQKSK